MSARSRRAPGRARRALRAAGRRGAGARRAARPARLRPDRADDAHRSRRGGRRARRRRARGARARAGARRAPDRRPRLGRRLPGLVLAAALPDAHVSLVESSAKKCAFLERAIGGDGAGQRRAGARAGRGVERRDRALRPRHRARGRAAERARRVRGAAARRRRRARRVEGPPRRRARRPTAAAAAAATGLELAEVRPVRPWDGAEHLHLHRYMKVGSTPNRYPRRAGNGEQTPATCGDLSAPSRVRCRTGHADRDPPGTVEGDGHRLRDRQPEGRGGQDDDGGQRRRLHRRGRLPDAADRHRPAGQRDARAGGRRRTSSRTSTTCSPAARRSPRPSTRPRSTG